MTIETGLNAHLLADGGVAAIVGDRVYPINVPQDVDLPAVAYMRISGAPDYTHDGESGLESARFQFTCEALTYSAAKGLALAVRAAISGYTGAMDDVTIGALLIENDRDGWSEGFRAPVVRLDAMIWWT